MFIGRERAPVKWEQAPVEREQAPDEWERAPVGWEQAPVGWELAPDGWERAPVGWELAPDGLERLKFVLGAVAFLPFDLPLPCGYRNQRFVRVGNVAAAGLWHAASGVSTASAPLRCVGPSFSQA